MKYLNTLKSFLIKVILLSISFNSFSSDLYWRSGNGNWSDATKWSNTSGGSSCNCTPTAADNVFFDFNSFLS